MNMLSSLPAVALAIVTLMFDSACWAQEYRTFKPAGTAPAPILLFVSGCSGFVKLGDVDIYAEKAEAMSAAGYFVVFVDYLGKRNLANCTKGIPHATAAQDMVQAAAWAKQQQGVDGNRVYAIGWSYGGGVVIAALDAGMPLNKAVMLYPDCRSAQPWSAPVPALVLFGDQDTVAPPALCDSTVKGAPAGSLRVITYPNSYHAFDARGLPAKTTYAFGTIGYNEAAGKAAWSEIAAFLK